MINKFKKNNYAIGSLLIVFFFFLYVFRLYNSYYVDNDFARDLVAILDITKGKMTLVGPDLSFGGILLGPYYYYLFVPIFFITRGDASSILYFNAFLFTATLPYAYIMLRKHYSVTMAGLATVAFALLPMYIFSARNPGNAYSYIPLLLIFLLNITFSKFSSRKELLMLGLLTGLILNFHYINIVIFIFAFFIILSQIPVKKNIFYYLLGALAPFVSLVIFELRHGFIVFKNTFQDKSNIDFVKTNFIENAMIEKSSFLTNIQLISSDITSQIVIPVFLALSYFIAVFFYKPKNRLLFLAIGAILGYVFTLFIMPFNYPKYFLFPFSFLIFFSLIMILLNYRWHIVIAIIVLAEIFFFPQSFYSESPRKFTQFENRVNEVVKQKIVTPDERFNIIQIRPEVLTTPYGYEYRFFLKKKGFTIDNVSEYKQSTKLLIFSRIPDYDIKNIDSWEIREFGKQYLGTAKVYKFPDVTVYKIVK